MGLVRVSTPECNDNYFVKLDVRHLKKYTSNLSACWNMHGFCGGFRSVLLLSLLSGCDFQKKNNIWLKFEQLWQYVSPPPPALGLRGELDLLCFPSFKCVCPLLTPKVGEGGTRFTVFPSFKCVSASVRPSASMPDFVYAIFPTVFWPKVFQFSDIVSMDKTLNWLTFRDLGSIFKVTKGHYVSKLTLFTWYFL